MYKNDLVAFYTSIVSQIEDKAEFLTSVGRMFRCDDALTEKDFL